MLHIEALSKRFGSVQAVDDLSLDVGRGEFLTLLGPSGCGKTTTLRMIAGFESPTSGRVIVDGRDVTRLPAQKRGFGMVFQNYALFPHLNVFENVAFGLKAQGAPRGDIAGRVQAALGRVDLEGYEKRSVQALSGGQQQRVALARALAPEPPLLLLDEPLSNLDAALRERTRTELRRLLKDVGITAIFVTHDQEEAFALSDRIAVMRDGHLQQAGTPEELYRAPANPFVASFVGKANFLEGRVNGDGRVELGDAQHWQATVGNVASGETVRLLARPEDLTIDPALAAQGDDGLPGQVIDRRFAGALTTYRIRLQSGQEITVAVSGPSRIDSESVRVFHRAGRLPVAFPATNDR